MNFISKLPGPLLIFFGAFCLSFGGLIVKSFEGSTLWQILFWRQVFFVVVVTIFLIVNYKKDVFNKIYISNKYPIIEKKIDFIKRNILKIDNNFRF